MLSSQCVCVCVYVRWCHDQLYRDDRRDGSVAGMAPTGEHFGNSRHGVGLTVDAWMVYNAREVRKTTQVEQAGQCGNSLEKTLGKCS